MQLSDFFQFEKFLAPILIKIVYWVGLVFIGLSTIMGIFGMSMMSRMMGGENSGFSIWGALFAIIGGVILAIVWRVVCELWIVIFSINDRLGVMSGQTAKS